MKKTIVETEGGKYARYQLKDYGNKVYIDQRVGYREEPVGTAKSRKEAIELIQAHCGKDITSVDDV